MPRSAASPGSVGFGRLGSGASGLLMTPLPAGHRFSWLPAKAAGPVSGRRLVHSVEQSRAQIDAFIVSHDEKVMPFA